MHAPRQVFGGLIVGMVVKYADNILKNFANALSVIFTVVGAIPLFQQYPSAWFIVGVAAVLLSVFMYGKSTPPVRIPLFRCHAEYAQLLTQSHPACYIRPPTPTCFLFNGSVRLP